MSEKSLRGAGPKVDQSGASSLPAAPATPGGGSSDTAAAPVEPWGGERTDRVSGRENSGPRVALVPTTPPDGQIDSQASAADTRRVADSGRTTLMGVPSPFAGQSDKPTTSPGHDVHLPSDKARVADARPVAAGGLLPSVELAPSSTTRVGKSEPPGKPSGHRDANAKDDTKAATSDGAEKSDRKDSKDSKDSKAGVAVPSERSMAAAAATFRASTTGGETQPAVDPTTDREQERSWTADRTQEFRLDLPPARSGFAKTLAAGMALAAGTGILVVGFVHSRVRGGAESSEVAHAPGPLPVAPVPLPPPPLPENPVPPLAVEQTPPAANVAPEPAAPEAPAEAPAATQEAPPQNVVPDELNEAPRAERRGVARAKTPTPPGRPAAVPRTARAPATAARPGATPLPGAMAAPAAVAPTTPPPLTASPPEKPAPKPELPKVEGGKPYDPDMPLPPSTE